MTIREAIAKINSKVRAQLPNKDADTVRIMEFVAEMNEMGLLQSLDKPLTKKQEENLGEVLERIEKDEPLEYIVGTGDFQGRRFYVSKSTLIPRPETELLVDMAVGQVMDKMFEGNEKTFTVVDVGTGSGCIVVSMALMLREKVEYYASDISPDALSVAQKNIAEYELDDKVKTLCGDLLEPFEEDVKFDMIVANLPYLKDDDFENLDASVGEFEPRGALAGGEDGAELIGRLLEQASGRLNDGGMILLEVQPEIVAGVTQNAETHFPNAKVSTQKDLEQKDRYIFVEGRV